MNGLILKKNADKFTVELNGKPFIMSARNLKKDGIFVGDRVECESGVIEKVYERKNILVRPPLANVDTMIIVVAMEPKPDFLLVDKLLVFCVVKGIKPILCINKSDLSESFVKDVKNIYKGVVDIVSISTLDESVMKLKKYIKGITALAGQSAVGKSSIINALLGKEIAIIGDFSKKVMRGKQTTRLVELYDLGDNKYLADTAGFSKLSEELLIINENELKDYYPDFINYAHMCKYKSCQHLGAKDCGVVKAVNEGKISKIRYKNYKILRENIKKVKKF